MKKPLVLYFLIILILFVSVCGIFGGWNLIKDPTGKSLQFPDNYLKNTIFQDYFFPGIILFTIIGIFPLLIIYGIIKNSLDFLEIFNIYKDEKWQFSFIIYYGIILIVWIDVQIIMVPYFILQPIISLIGVVIILLSLSSSIREHFLK
ncbi:Uncharacterised protein [uncultured archaeon]|nr:Uncharacterised protein [uncultured archaeon]